MLENKADISDIERLDEKMRQECVPKNMFLILKSTVANKAEWTDLNDTIQ